MLWRGANEFRVFRELRVYAVSVAPVIGWMMAFHSVYCVLCGTEGGVCLVLCVWSYWQAELPQSLSRLRVYGDWYTNHWWETTLVISVALQRLWLWSVCGGGGGGGA